MRARAEEGSRADALLDAFRPRNAGDPIALAIVVQRVAVLLGAGVAPGSAWTHAGGGTPLDAWARTVGRAEPGAVADLLAGGVREAGAGTKGIGAARAALRVGATRAAERDAHAGLAATWAVALASGSPLAAALRAYAELLRGFAATDRQSRIALSGPVATARLVMVMPVLGLVLGATLGQDTLGVLLRTPLGWSCLVVGGLLMLSAWLWNRALLRRAAAGDRLPGLIAELVATAMGGGVSADRARRIVAEAALRYGIPPDFGTVAAALRVATSAGAPVAELLRAEAEEARRAALAEAAQRVERLSVTLMLPLGVCVLPAFLVLGVVPMIVGLVSSAFAAM